MGIIQDLYTPFYSSNELFSNEDAYSQVLMLSWSCLFQVTSFSG